MGLRADDQSVGLTVWNPLAAELLSGALPRMPVAPDSWEARGCTVSPIYKYERLSNIVDVLATLPPCT